MRKGNPAAWVHRVAINLATSHFRRRAAERRALSRATHAGEHLDPPPDGDVMAAVARLPQRPKTALVLRHYLGYSTRETADLMDCSERTAKRLLQQAINGMRTALEVDDRAPMTER